jgi:hypothetical protein
MIAPLAALLLSLSAAPADTAWGEIRGTVASDPGGVPLALAVVETSAGGRALTDSTGSYDLPRVAAGEQTVRVHSIGHEPFEVEVYVPPSGVVTVDVALRHHPVELAPVTTLAFAVAEPPSEPAPRPESAITELTALEGPGTSGLDAVRSGGGGSGGGDVLVVRGSTSDLKLVLLDGAPVYAPFHMAGLIDSFDPNLLSTAKLYLGGAPAKYDGGVSYVLDLGTRAAGRERWSGAAKADVLAAGGEADGPLWRGAGLLLAARAIHGGTLAHLQGSPFPYGYSDALARLDVSLPRGLALAVTGFANGEAVRVDSLSGAWLHWGNGAGSARLRGRAGRIDGEVTAALSGFRATLPGSAMLVQSWQRRVRLAADFTRDAGALRLGWGYAYDREWARHRVLSRLPSQPLSYERDTVAMVGGWYADGLWRAGREWNVRGGVRGDMYAQGSFLSLSPRLAVTWLPTAHATVTLAGGRYHQLVLKRVEPPISQGGDPASSLGIPTVPAVASANHLTLSIDQELIENVRLGLEGYYKRFEGIPDPDEIGTYASGVDVWMRRAEGGLTGWLGYSLAWYWSRADTAATSARFSGRQIVSAGVAASGRRGRAEVRVAYGSGLPYSSLGSAGGSPPSMLSDGGYTLNDVPPQISGSVPQDFLRIDVQVSRALSPRIGGRRTELTPYFRVLNALDRRDALFYRYNPAHAAAAKPVATLPLVPVLGLEWKL